MISKLKFSLALWLYLFSLNSLPAFAANADVDLLIRDHCAQTAPTGTGATNACPAATERETAFNSQIAHKQNDEFSVDIYIKNPSSQKIISVQSWLEYDKDKLEGIKIDTSVSAFDFVAPGEDQFDAEKGLARIGRSAVSKDTRLPELLVATLTFKVKTNQGGNAILKFYDYQISELWHTSVMVMEESFPVNILESKPKDFVISLNGGSVQPPAGTVTPTQPVSTPPAQPSPPLTLTRPTGVKAATGPGYIFLVWDLSKDTSLKGYNLYYSTTSGRYLQRRPVGKINQYELDYLETGKTYYLALTAYDSQERETDFSDEVKITVGDPNSSSSPLLLSKDAYLKSVPSQPANGPEIWIIALIAITFISIISSVVPVKVK